MFFQDRQRSSPLCKLYCLGLRRALSWVLALWILILPGLAAWFSPSQASASSAADLVAAVNDLRAANGLPPLQVDAALMAAAQTHSEFQAANDSMSHAGAGGSYIAKNFATGTNMTAQRAVEIWQGDSTHLNTMLGKNYQDVGAGYAVAGDRAYFTLNVAYPEEAAGSGRSSLQATPLLATPSPAATGSSPSATSGTPEKAPVVTSTTAADGSVVHIVQLGQTLWDVAMAYGMNIADLMAQNGLTEKSVIYPGWKLVIVRPNRTPTSLPTDTSTPRPPPPTRLPTRTPAPAATRTRVATPTMDATALSATATAEMANLAIDVRRDPLLIVIGILVVAGTGLVVAGSLLRRKP